MGFGLPELLLLLIIILCLLLYFVPARVAYRRHHPACVPILALNIFLGWTLLGWMGVLVWALSRPTSPPAQTGTDLWKSTE